MSADRLRRAAELFDELVDLPSEEQEERLAAVEDDALRAEVQSLLGHHVPADDFLDRPALGTGFRLAHEMVSPESFVGSRFGAWRIERPIGSGGMGDVYLAARADGHFDLQAALKIVKPGMDSREVLARFERERDTLARLNHPNIGRLLDGGVVEGRPYLVMEYVEGEPLTTWCDGRHLSIPQRVRLFREVCGAVQYAHANLVVHRDLKPSNVLVTADGVPKLLDFGIAKILEPKASEDHTLTGGTFLTPEYASPEQVRGEPITTASDVYSLGVILYELLTGVRPSRAAGKTSGPREKAIADTSPPKPSGIVARLGTGGRGTGPTLQELSELRGGSPRKVSRRLRGDLDNIVLTALRSEPARRYASVEQFSNDLLRFLEGRPVQARRDTIGYRVGKFVRRNRGLVAAFAALILSLVAGMTGIAWQAGIAREEAERAEEEARRAREQTVIAQKERDEALESHEQAEVTRDFLEDLLLSADPAREGADVTVRQVLDASAPSIDEQFGHRPDIAAGLHATIGQAYHGLGSYEEAESHLRQALETWQVLGEQRTHEQSETMNSVATVLYARGQFEEAEAMLREALVLQRRLREHPELLQQLHGEREGEDEAQMLNNLAAALRAQGELAEAEQVLRETIAVRRTLHGTASLPVAESLNNLGNVLRLLGRPEEAEPVTHEALEIREALLEPGHPLRLQSLANRAVLLHGLGRFEEAESMYRRALAGYRETLPEAHPDLLVPIRNLGALLLLSGQLDEALSLFEEGWAIAEQAFSPADPRALEMQMLVARCHYQDGRLARARELLEQALSHGPTDPRLAGSIREILEAIEKAERD